MAGFHPALTLPDATRNLTPDVPLADGHPWYVDLATARGDQGRALLKKEFLTKGDDFLFAIFASDRGLGKSTELLHLERELKGKFESIHLIANSEFEADGIDADDFQLVLCRAVEKHMREVVQKPIPENVLKPIEDWFSEVTKQSTLGTEFVGTVKSGFEAKSGIPFFGNLFASLTALVRKKSEHKTSVKSVIRRFPGALTSAANKLLDAAGNILGADGRQLLLVIDNMDRYTPASMDDFLAVDPDTLKSLRANFLVTPPVDLIHKPKTKRLNTIYRTFILPSVKLRNANDPYDTVGPPGLEPLLEVLRRRIDLDRLIPDKESQKRLVLASGGTVRELVDFTRQATLVSNSDTVSRADVEYVVVKERSNLRDFIDLSGYWPVLGMLAANKRFVEDPKCADLLYHRLAFQYNGENWFDVHPLLAELPSFADSLKRARTALGKITT